MWDAIVVGSGIGGLAAAAALARRGKRVLVLEQHTRAGGLTQTFRRRDWCFATGVHYIGGVGPQPGPEGQFGRLLGWLSGDALHFAACANPYDIVQLPGLRFGIEHPESAYRGALAARFPEQIEAIDRWFEACAAARQSAFALFAMHSVPPWLAWPLRLWRGSEMQQWAHHTLADELARVPDVRLRAVLGARWGDYGVPPARAPFVEHALVTGSYNGGAYYPLGGPARFAEVLRPVIEAAGGELRLGADVQRILVQDGRAGAVEYVKDGTRDREAARHVISAMGVAGTVACLEPTVASDWRQSVASLAPGLSYVALYLGLEGDIAAAGAGSANHWIYESEDIGRLWRSPQDENAPSLFVSFPSLKDPSSHHEPTAEVIAPVDPNLFAPWLRAGDNERSRDYYAAKERVEARLLAQFTRHFPRLAPMVRYHEVSTPLTQRRYVRSPDGAMYGIEMSAERLTTPALHVRTPLPGLLLAGQDVTSPGIQGACMGGLLAAASVEPALWWQLRG